jgi:hypothetical protein
MEKQIEYVERLSAQMLAWDIQIDQFKDKAENAPFGTKSDYSEAIAALQIKRDEAAEKLQGISTASDHEWEELKEGTEHVWGEVRKMLFDAVIKIK